MDGFQIQREKLQNSTQFYQVKKKITIFVVGFSGIVDIGWGEESQRWMKYRLRDGVLLRDIWVR
jgi:hypothetical protein